MIKILVFSHSILISWSLDEKLVCTKIVFAIESNDQSMKTFTDVELEDVLERYWRWALRQEIIGVGWSIDKIEIYFDDDEDILGTWNRCSFQKLFNFLELLRAV